MWLSAVSAAVALAGFEVPQRQLVGQDDRVYQQVRKTTVMLLRDGQERGAAVCIDSRKGLFMIHRNLVTFPQLLARTPAGRIVTMNLRGFDGVSQLALLEMQREHYITMPSIKVAKEPTKPYPRLFAILPGGPIPVQLASLDRIGVVGETMAALPLLELKFEAALDRVGGAPIFDSQGQLVGVLNATLQGEAPKPESAGSGGSIGSYPAGTFKRTSDPVFQNQFGPTTLTVGYAVQPTVLNRVVSGFTSESKSIQYPALGIKLGDFKQEGVEIIATTIGMAADEAGLLAGDVIIEFGGQPIKNQVDYIRTINRFRVGQTVQVKVNRGDGLVTVRVQLKG